MLPEEFMQKGQELPLLQQKQQEHFLLFLPQTSLFVLNILTYLCLDFSNSEKSESLLWRGLFHKTQNRRMSFTNTVL